MGSRTNFGIATYREDDLKNVHIIMPSMSLKNFNPKYVQDAIIDNLRIDIQKALEGGLGWVGDDWTITNQEYLPTIILLEGEDSYQGSFVINYLISNNLNIYYRVFSFDQYKKIDLDELEKELREELESGQMRAHIKEHDELINCLTFLN